MTFRSSFWSPDEVHFERGLKQNRQTGVVRIGAALCGVRGIENRRVYHQSSQVVWVAPAECVDWNESQQRSANDIDDSRTLRECVDWKHLLSLNIALLRLSHSAWVRGLAISIVLFANLLWSHSAWVRGLKRYSPAHRSGIGGRTLRECVDWNTRYGRSVIVHLMSHSAWVRGLKQKHSWCNIVVALSHSAWVRGLKPPTIDAVFEEKQSHSAWVRGLKHPSLKGASPGSTSHLCVSAWIETCPKPP